ncbi:hypothetical protein [Rubrivirga sp. IMCC45206]|uniref:hypothetical protein n=1 Tax=Rubrivirga sp. IMCC45206 TaxID=3391614 RepID=UPI00398FFC28
MRNGDDVYLVELDGGGVRHIRTRASRRVRAACRSRSGPLYAWVDIEAMGTGADRVVGLGLTDEADEMYGLEVDAEAAARLLLEIGAGDPEGRGLFAATLSPSTTAARLAAVASAEGGAEAARREAAFVLSWRYRDAAAAPLEQMARGAHLPRRLREEAIVGLALTACGQHALRSLRAEGEPWVREFATAALALHHLRRWSGDLVVRSD